MSIFQFKQFRVEQSGCAMKINTDGVLLGAMAKAVNPQQILDIGTGTGVIALMLAQRFPLAQIDAVEIDETAVATAQLNFSNSPFAERLKAYGISFSDFFEQHPDRKYDLIVSNPPFFLNSLESPGQKRNLARHAVDGFYNELIVNISQHLSVTGTCQLIVPLDTAMVLKSLLTDHQLYLQKQTNISSFAIDAPHRQILTFGYEPTDLTQHNFVIYAAQKQYSADYQYVLRDFFTIF